MADWAKLKVVDLKAELKSRDLNANGLKAELVERLQADDLAKEDGAAAGDDEVHKAENDGAVEAEPAAAAVEVPDEKVVDAPEASADTNEEAQTARKATPGKTEQPVTVEEPAKDETTPAVAESAPDAMQTDEPSIEEPASKPQASAPSPAVETPNTATTAPDSAAILPSPESQKRKRRSLSPPPVEEDVARKRARADSDAGPKNGVPVGSETEIMSDAPPPPRSHVRDTGDRDPIPPPREEFPDRGDHVMDFERDVAPALHPATPALYINNLMRPLRPADLQSHLSSLVATSSSSSPSEIITTFFLDQIRTHALVVFNSTSSASRVRTALHDRVWPEESNRKALSVDFVPPEKVPGWIETEEGAGRGARTGSRWEIVYETLEDGTIEARLESGAVSAARPGPQQGARAAPPPPAGATPFEGTNSIPLGPRGFRDDLNPPPTGPRSSREQYNPQQQAPPPDPLGSLSTRARPSISYQPVAPSLARSRIDSMQSHYTRDTRRYLGREINRDFFEDGDKFVDRGKEVFEGIRPPHRDRGGGGGGFRGRGGRRGGGGGGGRGRGGDRMRGDRYLPGGGGRGRFGEDEGRLPRYADDR